MPNRRSRMGNNYNNWINSLRSNYSRDLDRRRREDEEEENSKFLTYLLNVNNRNKN